jgi:FkbM family methyltransferase
MIPLASTFAGWLMRQPLRLVPSMTPLRILTGPLAGKRWLSTSGNHGCWLGIYERPLQQLLARELKAGDVFYDVGANVGFFSLLASVLVGPRGRIVAFEPLPRNVDLLRANLDLNAATNVSVVAAAVAETAGSTLFATAGSPSMGTMDASRGLEVPVVGLDELVASGEMPVPTAIKMDIEGAESRALSGARKTLEEHHPVIFLSTHGYRQHDECLQLLASLGYTVRTWRDGSADGQYESVAGVARTERP